MTNFSDALARPAPACRAPDGYGFVLFLLLRYLNVII